MRLAECRASLRYARAVVSLMGATLLPAATTGSLAASAAAQTTGLTPLMDLTTGSYAGFPGGLYPDSSNTPPAAHLADALDRAAMVVPRDAAGNADPNGWIGMIAVGMSNTTHEFAAFERNADADTSRHARVVIVDTGFGGQTATVIANPAAGYWTTMMQRLAAMRLTAAQVQVAWLKEAESGPPNNFPLHAQALRDTLKRVVRNLHTKFPNLRLCYVSSRTYGRYSAQGTLNPEPQAYESGFSVKWLIEDQINGDPSLNYGRLPGDVQTPLLLWGPYLWADGVNPRSDGLVWLLSDFENDHVHPSAAGEQKVAGLLATFFDADVTAAPWWPARPDARLVTVDAIHDAYVSAAAPAANFGSSPQLLTQGGGSPLHTFVRFDASGITGPVQFAKLSLRVNQAGGGLIRRVDDADWDEHAITFENAPVIGPTLVTLPQSSRDGTIGANVTVSVWGDADDQIAFALSTPAAGQASYASKEAGEPPRLVLVVSNATAGAGGDTQSSARLAVAPNPAMGNSHVVFTLAREGTIDLSVYSIDGRRIRTLAHGPFAAGRHERTWDGLDGARRPVAPGIYLAWLTGGEVASHRIVRLR